MFVDCVSWAECMARDSLTETRRSRTLSWWTTALSSRPCTVWCCSIEPTESSCDPWDHSASSSVSKLWSSSPSCKSSEVAWERILCVKEFYFFFIRKVFLGLCELRILVWSSSGGFLLWSLSFRGQIYNIWGLLCYFNFH